MERKKIKNFRDLEVWQKGMDIVRKIYTETRQFPKDELYGLTSQLRRSAVSIPSNIAEGFTRPHKKEYVRYLHIALGSCAELETQIEISEQIGYLETGKKEIILAVIQTESKMLNSLVKIISKDDING